MIAMLTQSRRKARVCGCSSMAEQKLPKLLTSAVFRHPMSKTLHGTCVCNQTLGFSAQNKLAPLPGKGTRPPQRIGGARWMLL